jgi:hypothetical protein
MIRRVVAVILAVVAMTWAAPAAVSATADDSYVTPARVSVNPAVIEPGGTSTIEFAPGFFGAGESVTTDVSGVHARDAQLVGLDGETRLVSRADGGMTVLFGAPSRGSGRYAITFAASRIEIVIVTVVPERPAYHYRDAPAAPLNPTWPLLGVEPPAIGEPTAQIPGGAHNWSGDHDREGRVQIPATPPQTPGWPGLEDLPWSIILLAAIALIVTTVAATLAIAARRRG